MKRRTYAKQRTKLWKRVDRARSRENDKHDRGYVLAFMRQCIELLAPEDVGVDRKVLDVAAIARRLGPAIMSRRAALKEGTET